MIRHFAKNHQVYLISLDSSAALAALPEGRLLAGNLPQPGRALSELWIATLIVWLKKNKVDLCHFHLGGTYGLNARSWSRCPITRASQAGIRCMVTNHQAVRFCDHLVSKRPMWREMLASVAKWPGKAKQLSAVETEVMVSEHDLALSKRYFPFHHRKFLRIYHSRLDASVVSNSLATSRMILNVATLTHRKGQHVLLEAFASVEAEFPEWRLQLVGYDSNDGLSARLRERITVLGLSGRVEICGPHVDPTSFYRGAEIYVQPSLLEGLGLSLQEAMFYGVPVIGSRLGGIPELIVNGQTGCLVEPGDVLSLAKALRCLMGDRMERERLGAGAQASVRDRGMTSQSMLMRYEELYGF
jgi:glycosyltransferase involved in cell wall biosynthesis